MTTAKDTRRKNRSGAVYLRVSLDLLKAIDKAAKKDQRTRSDWIRVTLDRVIAEL